MIYLASPYSHPEFPVRYFRHAAALRYTSMALARGEVIFSPIVYGYSFRNIAGDYQTWQSFNDELLLRAEECRVLRLEDWEQSAGIKYELEFAARMGIAITYVDPMK